MASLRGLETCLFVVALAAMGTGVRLAELRRVGIRPIAVGLAAWLLVSAVAAAGVAVSH